MKCEDVIEKLQSPQTTNLVGLRAARAHADSCKDCAAALVALAALEAEAAVSPPRARPGAFNRALEQALTPRRIELQPRRGFWLGAAVGGLLAASLAVFATMLWLAPQAPASFSNPAIRLAMNEQRDVNVSLESPEALADAEIHVVLTGSIGLKGFGTQRELRWTTNIDRGANQLTLPLVALGADGGQIMVEVVHGDRRRTFVVDVQTQDPEDPTALARLARPPVSA